MKLVGTSPALLLLAAATLAAAQDDLPPEPHSDFRYSVSVINDATFYSDLRPPLPESAYMLADPSVTLFQNQSLVEPSFTFRYRSRWSLASSVVGLADSFRGLSAADFNLPPGNVAAGAALDAAIEPYTGTHAKLMAAFRQETSISWWAEKSYAGERVMRSAQPECWIRLAIPPTPQTG